MLAVGTTWPTELQGLMKNSIVIKLMKICIVHNEYGRLSGEEVVVQSIQRLLEENGHQVIPFTRSSAEIPEMPFGRVRAFISGIYSNKSIRTIQNIINKHNPDIIHIHNLYPFISPSILPVCRNAGIPIVMTVHNYRLICPKGLHMYNGKICEKCAEGHEYWCIFRNCEASYFKSFGYALRNWFARKRRLYINNIAIYATLTHFQRQRLIKQGFPADKITVIPNMANSNGLKQNIKLGDYVGFIGRVSPEKGTSVLMDAARKCTEISFKVAGSYDRMPHLPKTAPFNFEFRGYLDRKRIDDFYAGSRMIIVPSLWYETFGLVVAEAMLIGKPVICSRIGGLPEIVDDGVTGLLFEPGNAEELAEKIRYLWERPDLCREMGNTGCEKALHEYSPERYYERLMRVYGIARQLR